MFLLVLESLGTQELILIALVALIFLGPRRLPEYARKIGKVVADLRQTSNEFRQTWEREVDLEGEGKALDLNAIEREVEEEKTIARGRTSGSALTAPEVRSIDKSEFEKLSAAAEETSNTVIANEKADVAETLLPENEQDGTETDPLSDKRTWL